MAKLDVTFIDVGWGDSILIEHEGPMRPSELVERMGLRTLQHLSNLSRGLVSAGLVVKQKTRGRATWLYPTTRAQRLSPFLRRPRPEAGSEEVVEGDALAAGKSFWHEDLAKPLALTIH